MKRLKKMIHNCPYLAALLTIWLVLTIGGMMLILYRDYGKVKWGDLVANPLFAVVWEVERQNNISNFIGTESVMARLPERNHAMTGRGSADSALAGIGAQVGMRAEKELAEEEKAQEAGEEQEAEEAVIGETVFVDYPPVETDSIYYEDVGKTALTTDYPYRKVGEDYFQDAAFLGDSRTIGISDYAGLDADFYCENGMTIYKLLGEKGVTWQKTGEKVDLNQVLQQKRYGKIYIMLGMNELGYGDTGYFREHYQAVLEQIREWQPQAVIFLMANLHVSAEKNNLQTEFNNININAKNVAAATLADGIDVFYLDSNPYFTDENGLLKADLTFDGVHLYADNYAEWKNFLMEHGVVREAARKDIVEDGNETE
ncbi:MAG: GDSL-type esterase/lipase family protein [Blautia sp.]|nr:GDSL-type esterase/lipase family protein [Blautia sp.]MCM1201681.1 GDSL-type esterase/lipase family protein [Bacteroides fragilis]